MHSRAVPALLVAPLAALLAGCGSTRTVVHTVTVVRTTPGAALATGDQRIFGRIKSVRRNADGYELSFDPAWFLSGITANAAQAEDLGTQCAPSDCPPVANDNVVEDEGHRVFVYLLPDAAPGTVLTKVPTGFLQTHVTGAQLAQIVDGTSPLRLFEPLSTGVWLLVHIDTVRSFSQQYRP